MKFLTASFVLCLLVPFLAHAASKRYEIPVGDSPSWGPANAPVIIIEFIDYQ
jgi:hypothetical protein